MERLIDSEPFSTQSHAWIAVAQLQLGQFEKSERSANRAYELGFSAAVFVIAEAKFLQGDIVGAKAVVLDSYDENAYFFPQFSNRDELEYALDVLYGDDINAKKEFATFLEQSIDPDYPVPSSTVGAWRWLEQPDKFIDSIDSHIFGITARLPKRLPFSQKVKLG